MTTLTDFLRTTTENPFLVARFHEDPDATLKEHDVDPKYWDALKSGNDVQILNLVLQEQEKK